MSEHPYSVDLGGRDVKKNTLDYTKTDGTTECIDLSEDTIEIRLSGKDISKINLAPLKHCKNLMALILSTNPLPIVDVSPLIMCPKLTYLALPEGTEIRFDPSNYEFEIIPAVIQDLILHESIEPLEGSIPGAWTGLTHAIYTDFRLGHEITKIVWLDNTNFLCVGNFGTAAIIDSVTGKVVTWLGKRVYDLDGFDQTAVLFRTQNLNEDEEDADEKLVNYLEVYLGPTFSLQARIEVEHYAYSDVSVVLHPKKNQIILGRNEEISIYNSKNLELIDTYSCKDEIESFLLSPDGDYLIVNSFYVYDTESWELKWEFPDLDEAPEFVFYSPTNTLAHPNDVGGLNFLRLSDGRSINKSNPIFGSRFYNFAINSDGKLLSVIRKTRRYQDGPIEGALEISLWKIPEYEKLWSFEGVAFGEHTPLTIQFNPNGTKLAVGCSRGAVRILSVTNEQQEGTQFLEKRSGVQRQKTSDLMKEDEPEVSDTLAGVNVFRGYQISGNSLTFKVKIQNNSESVITNILVSLLSYPGDCLKLASKQTHTISRIEINGFRSHSFTFTPTNDCVEGKIIATVAYVDHQDQAHHISLEPQIIRSICDLLQPLETSFEELSVILHDMEETNQEMRFNLNAAMLYDFMIRLLPSKNFHILAQDSHSVENSFYGSIKCSAKGKYTQKKVGLDVVVVGLVDTQTSTLKINAGGEDIAMLPPTITELLDEVKSIRHSMEQIHHGIDVLTEAAGETKEFQQNLIELVTQLDDKVDTQSHMAREILVFLEESFQDISSGRSNLKESLLTLNANIDDIAKKLGIEKELKDRIKDTITKTVSDEVKKGLITKVKEKIGRKETAVLLLTIARRVLDLLGVPIP